MIHSLPLNHKISGETWGFDKNSAPYHWYFNGNVSNRINRKRNLDMNGEMNSYTSNDQKIINRRMELSPIQRKIQRIDIDPDRNELKMQTPQKTPNRRVRRDRSRSHEKKKRDRSRSHEKKKRMNEDSENMTPLHTPLQTPVHRKVHRTGSSRGSGQGMKKQVSFKIEKSQLKRNKTDSVLELLELLQGTSDIMSNPAVNAKEERHPPERSCSEEFFTPSQRHQRTGARVPLRMMPKTKPSSMGNVYAGCYGNPTSSKKKSPRKKKDVRAKEEDSATPIKRGESERQEDPSDRARRPSLRSSSAGDLYNEEKASTPKEHLRRGRKDDRRTVDEFLEEFSPMNGRQDRWNEGASATDKSPTPSKARLSLCETSVDNSFFQEASSALGDFHGIDRGTRYRQLSKSQETSVKPDEKHQRQPMVKEVSSSDRTSSDRSSSGSSSDKSSSVEVHSAYNLSESNQEEDEKTRRRRKKCSAGGIVRNHRTNELYTGFFLSNETENNLKHGYGITNFPDGRLFEGIYENGLMVEGKMTYPAKPPITVDAAAMVTAFRSNDPCQSHGTPYATYVGKFDGNGLRCGKGIYTTSKTTFLGQFKRDQQHGSGMLIYHDGNNVADTSNSRRFIGHWKEGLKHGYGREILADGTISREGQWEEGRFQGGWGSPQRSP